MLWKKPTVFLKRTPLKRTPFTLKRKQLTDEEKELSKDQETKDWEFYSMIWGKRPHYCQSCGKFLGNILSKAFMDHLLDKAIYPDLRYEEDNIFLVCLDDHGSKGMGHPTKTHQEAIERAKEKFLNVT